MSKIFEAYNKTKNAKAKINEAKNQAKKEYDERVVAYEKAKERGDKTLIKNIEIAIKHFQQVRDTQLQEQALKMREGIVAEITAKIKNLGNAVENLIFDKSGNSLNGVPIFIFSPEKADMSQRVMGALNQNQSSSFLPNYGLQLGLADMSKIFKAYNKTKDAEAKINEDKNQAKKEYDERADAYKKAFDEINNLNRQLSAPASIADAQTRKVKERDDKIANIKAMERDINEFRQTRERQLQEQAAKMREGIIADITKLIGDRLINGGDCVVVDLSGFSLNGVPIALYTNGLPDFSDDVISALNQGTGSEGSILSPSKPFVSSKTLRFGKIDMTRAFKALPETKQAEAKINAAKAKAARDLGDKPDPKAKEAKDKELQAAAFESRQVIVNKIRAGLSPVAEKGGFNLIFDSSGNSLNGVPLLIASRDIPDLTDDVIAKVEAR